MIKIDFKETLVSVIFLTDIGIQLRGRIIVFI